MKFNSSAVMFPQLQLGPTQSTPDNGLKGVTTLSEQEKLLIYYATNLYLLGEDETALKLIKKYSV